MYEAESTVAGFRIHFENIGAGDIGGHEVGSELNALETELQSTRQGRNQEGFRQTGNSDQQGMTATENRHQCLINYLILPDDDAA